MNHREAVVLEPHLAVHVTALRRRHVDLRHILVELAGEREQLEALGLGIELRDGGLKADTEPEIALAVSAQAELTQRPSRLGDGD
jgi:hypothetical protein